MFQDKQHFVLSPREIRHKFSDVLTRETATYNSPCEKQFVCRSIPAAFNTLMYMDEQILIHQNEDYLKKCIYTVCKK